MEEGDADAGGGVVEEGAEAEVVAAGLCLITYPHSSPPAAHGDVSDETPADPTPLSHECSP